MTLDTIPGFISIGMDDGPTMERTGAPSFGKSYKEQQLEKGYNFARENDIYSTSTSEHDSIIHKEITFDQYDKRVDSAHNRRQQYGQNNNMDRPSRTPPRRISVPPRNAPQRPHSPPRRISVPPRNNERPMMTRPRTPPRRISVPPKGQQQQPRRSSMGHQRPYNSHESFENHHHHHHHHHGNNHNATWDRHDGEQQQQRGHNNMPPTRRQPKRSSMGHQMKYHPQDANHHHHHNNGGEYNEHHHHHHGEQQHENNNAPPPRRRQLRRRSNESERYRPPPEPMPRPVDHHPEQQQQQQQQQHRFQRPSRVKSMDMAPRRQDSGRRSPVPRRRASMGGITSTTMTTNLNNRETSNASPVPPDSNKLGLLTGMKYAVDPMERLNPTARKLMEARKLRKAARMNFG